MRSRAAPSASSCRARRRMAPPASARSRRWAASRSRRSRRRPGTTACPARRLRPGMVDLVLTPARSPARLDRDPGSSVPRRRRRARGEPSSDERSVGTDLFTLLRQVSGVDFRQYKPPTIRRRLMRRMALHRLTDLSAYIRDLRDDRQELDGALAGSADSRHAVLPGAGIVCRAGHARVPAACSSAARPIGRCASGCQAVRPARRPTASRSASSRPSAIAPAAARVQIFATDVSEGAIEHARAGIYPRASPTTSRRSGSKRFFQKADGGYKVNKALRDMCVFARHDLTRDPPFSRLDLIVCRNVLIYLDADAAEAADDDLPLRAAADRLPDARSRRDGRAAAAVHGRRQEMAAVSASRRVESAAASRSHRRAVSLAGTRRARRTRRAAARGARSRSRTRPTASCCSKYGPPGVVVDANLQIVRFRGQVGPYLEPAPGEPSLERAEDGARRPALFVAHRAVRGAFARTGRCGRKAIHVQSNGGWQAHQPRGDPARRSRAAVTFSSSSSPRPRRTPGVDEEGRRTRAAQGERDDRVDGLTRELAASREYLQSIIQELEAANEELQSANEEVLSSNEELQSTNEELDTAKEELQSTNEELNTVNEELHSRNDELSRVNSDLVNLLASVEITIAIVGCRHAHPALHADGRARAEPDSDRRRPADRADQPEHRRHRPRGADARQRRARHAARGGGPGPEAGTGTRSACGPYRSLDNRIDGAVLALIDIDAAKRHQEQVDGRRQVRVGARRCLTAATGRAGRSSSDQRANAAFSRASGPRRRS